MTTELPPTPEGFRYIKKQKRAWTFVLFQKHCWYGWKTLRRHDLLEFVK